jgi:hypothetical protein
VTFRAQLTDRVTQLADDMAGLDIARWHMITDIGEHIHTVDSPDADFVIDVVAPQGSASAWYRVHDENGHPEYLSAEDAIPHGRHRVLELPGGPWPPGRGATVNGVLSVAAMWFATSARR